MKSVLHLTGLALSLCVACGPSVSDGDGGDDADDGGRDDGSDDDGSGSNGPCTTASECPGDQVCDPRGGVCTDDLPCSTHTECGGGGYCNADSCEENSTGGPCDDTVNCPAGETCTAGFCGCEGVAFQAEPVTPNVLILLDRSQSMDEPIGAQTKWQIAGAAIAQILADFGARVRFGLSMYASVSNPGSNACNAGQIDVDVADGTGSAIQAAIAATEAETNTPIGAALAALLGYSGLADPARPNYVLLLTDGEENCGGNGVAAVTSLRAQTPEVKTFVVGFGGQIDQDALNAMADAGGTAQAGALRYYQADNAQALGDAFESIIGTVLSCNYELSEVPADIDSLFVYFDQNPVDRDTTRTDGWDHDAASNVITFYGPSCDALEAGSVTNLVIVYGCPSGGVD
jgi:von Willebrand factor type A domain